MFDKHIREFRILLAAVLLLAMPWALCAEEKQPKQDNVALVNGSEITRDAFNREMGRVQRQIVAGRGKLDAAQMPMLQKQVLDSMIGRELLFQESLEKDISVEEAEITKQMASIKSRYPSEEAFKSALLQNGIDEATLKAEIKKMMTIKKFVEVEFKDRSKVSDEEVKAFYDSHPKQFTKPEEVRASHILVKVEETATEEQKSEARKKIEDVQARIKKGEDFGALAKELSDCPSSEKNGDLNYFSRGQGMVKPFEDAAFALKKDEVSGVVETQFGYHLIKLTDKRPETVVAYETVQEKLKGFMQQNKMQQEIQKHVEKIRSETQVETFL